MIRAQDDLLGVCSECLAEIMRDWLARWEIVHPPEISRSNQHGESDFSGTYIADGAARSKGKVALLFLSEKVGVSSRRLCGIIAGESATTSWAVADRILCELARPDLLQGLTVYHRDSASLRARGYRGGHICAHDILAVYSAAENGTPRGVVERSGERSGSSYPVRGVPLTIQTEKAA